MMVSKIISYHFGQFKFIACEACYGLHELHAFATASQLPYYFYQLLLALYAHQLILTECTLLIILYASLIFFDHLSTFVELLFIKILEFLLQLKLLLLASNIPLPNLSHIGPIPFFIFVKRIAYLIQISLHFFFIELLPISNLIQTNSYSHTTVPSSTSYAMPESIIFLGIKEDDEIKFEIYASGKQIRGDNNFRSIDLIHHFDP